jgi:predicted permease
MRRTQWYADLRALLESLFRRRRLRDRVDEELRFHLDMRTSQLMAGGLSRDVASRRAVQLLGNPPALRERTLDARRYGSMERLCYDIAYAARGLRSAPGFTAVAVASLALGIGANAAIFSLIDRVMLRLLPVDSPHALVVFNNAQSYPRYQFFRDNSRHLFDGVFGFANVSQVAVDGNDDPASYLEGRLITGNYFDALGVKPRLGRLITPEDDRDAGAHPVIVISHAFWQRRFNGDPAVLEQSMRLSPGTLSSGAGTGGFESTNDSPAQRVTQFRIIGVAPAGFSGETVGQHPDFWVPIMMQEHFMPGRPWLKRATASWVRAMARLQPGISLEQAKAGGTVLLRQAMTQERGAEITNDDRRGINAANLGLTSGDKGFGQLRGQFSQPLTVLMVMVAVVLLIACANLANLLLARGSSRRREISIRMAIGAGRARVIRQLLTESVLLALIGGAVALAVAWWGSGALFSTVAETNSSLRLDLRPDLRTFGFTAAVSLATALLFGLMPAIRATRVDVSTALKESGRSTFSGGKLGRTLVAVQVTLSVILLMGTGLFTRTLYNMKAQDLGYEPDDVILMRVDPISAGYVKDDIGRICVRLLERVRAIPGVTAATFSENGLFSGTESGASVTIEGFKPSSQADSVVRFDQVGPGYFTNVGIPLLLGRDFTESDNERAPRVAVINDRMARFYFPNQNPLGKLITGDDMALTIVGVSTDARDHGLRVDINRRMYVSYLQPIDGLTTANFEVRTSVPAARMTPMLRSAVREVAPSMPVLSIKALTRLIDESLVQERLIARLSVLFGIVAVILASVGLYGVLSYAVVRRTNEIGIRMAIGAFPRSIVWMVLRETLLLVSIGIVCGIPIALALTRFVSSLLFGLQPNDALTIAAVVVLMVVIAIAAATAPARRAAAVDPLSALRCE